MGKIGNILGNLIERTTGRNSEWLRGKFFALIDKQLRAEAWFSQDAQTKAALEKFGIDLVIDVGANEGQFARNLRAYYGGEIVSFEPVSRPFGALSRYAAADGLWRAFQLAA